MIRDWLMYWSDRLTNQPRWVYKYKSGAWSSAETYRSKATYAARDQGTCEIRYVPKVPLQRVREVRATLREMQAEQTLDAIAPKPDRQVTQVTLGTLQDAMAAKIKLSVEELRRSLRIT